VQEGTGTLKRVEKLFPLTSELREELKATPTTDVLPVKRYKRMQEKQKTREAIGIKNQRLAYLGF
jgi:hypothetical protein